MNFFRKLWSGTYSLPVAFWGFYCVGLFASFIVSGLILFMGRLVHARPIAFIIGLALTVCYWLVATVGVWRSASPYWASPIWMDRIRAATARFSTVAWFAGAMFRLVDGGAMAVMQRMTEGTDF
jgi:hypothetical protein